MMVDLMLRDENLGYHDENWNARIWSGVVDGNKVGWGTEEGIAGEKMVVSRKGKRSKIAIKNGSATTAGLLNRGCN